MILLLDTSILIDLENRLEETLENLTSLKAIYPDVPKISFMTYFEFLFGLGRMGPRNKEKSLAFIEIFSVIQTTKNTARVLAVLKEKYPGISFSDLFIASQAIENGMMLVTRDQDFSRIGELEKTIF